MTQLTIEGVLSLSRNGHDAGRLVPDVDPFGLRTWRWERPGEGRARRYLRIDHALLDAEAEEASTPPDSDAALFAFGVWCLIAGQAAGATLLRPLSPRISGYPSNYSLPRVGHCALIALRADGTCAGMTWNLGERVMHRRGQTPMIESRFKTRAGSFQESRTIHASKTLGGAVPRLVRAAMSARSAHDRVAAAQLIRQVQRWIQAPGAQGEIR
jgi:hypothetical protein